MFEGGKPLVMTNILVAQWTMYEVTNCIKYFSFFSDGYFSSMNFL
jgi:hypothetical protein